jgi:hypothetical protein
MNEPGIELEPGRAPLVATRKGLFALQANASRTRWHLCEPLFLGHITNHAVLDPRDGRSLLVAAVTGHLGPTIFRSTDAGRNWQEATQPAAFDKARPGEKARVVHHTF